MRYERRYATARVATTIALGLTVALTSATASLAVTRRSGSIGPVTRQAPHRRATLVEEGAACQGKQVTVGVVVVCAQRLGTSHGVMTAGGNVVIDGSLSVDGSAVRIDQTTQEISLQAPAPLWLQTTQGKISLGEAAFTIEAAGTTESASGAANLATISLTGARLGGLEALRVGGLPFTFGKAGEITAYLDREMGGGLVVPAHLQLPTLHKLHAAGSVSLAFLAEAPHAVIALDASVSVGGLEIISGWQLGDFSLTYQEPSDTWTVSGNLEAPIGSLQASGSVVHGELESLRLQIGGQAVPLGDSGFYLSEFGGELAGLAHGPLQVEASTGGYWGAPKAPVEAFYLDKVALTFKAPYVVRLAGSVSVALRSHSPLHGHLSIAIDLEHHSGRGTFSVEGSLPGVSMVGSGEAGFAARHFTAIVRGKIRAYGVSLKGEVISSDEGLGGSGSLCGAPFCPSIAFAGTWEQIGALDIPSIIGGEPRKLITVAAASSSGEAQGVSVLPARSLLLISVCNPPGPTGAPSVHLSAPDGMQYSSSEQSKGVVFFEQPQFDLTTVTVMWPAEGRWRILTPSSARSCVKAQTLSSSSLIQAKARAAASSSHRPLVVKWTSGHPAKGVHVTIIVRSKRNRAGEAIKRGLKARGEYPIPAARLRTGSPTIVVEATFHGVPFEQVSLPG